jgi:hypothetical protein
MWQRQALAGVGVASTMIGGIGLAIFGRSIYFWESIAGWGFALALSVPTSGRFPEIDKRLVMWIYLCHTPLVQGVKDVLNVLHMRWPNQSAMLETVALLSLWIIMVYGYQIISSFSSARAWLFGEAPGNWIYNIIIKTSSAPSRRPTV